ncbi:MAG: extracellular solute-binding protein [Lachnospiraceae bacterium]|nr:extracellular solute-binding protein [Lachnospiraceae bacterium]
MNLKRVAALLLSITVAVTSLAGCGNNGGGNDSAQNTQAEDTGSTAPEADASDAGSEATDTEPAAEGGTVEFWNDKMANIEQASLDTVLGTIQSVSGYTLDMIPYPDTASYQTAMQQTIRDQKAPGLFTWWSGSQLQTLVENGLVEDLTSVWESSIFDAGVSQGIADAFTFDGKVYAAPWSVLYNVVLYNKTVFDQYGLKEPETFDEFLQVCETLKSNGVTPIALKSDSWAGFIWFQALLAAKDVELYKGICDGSIKYTDPRVVEVMEVWKDMLDKDYFSVPIDWSDVRPSFAKGEVAMMLEPHVEFTGMKKDFDMVEGENIDAFVVPAMDGGKKTIFFEAAPLCVSTASAQKEDALKVLSSWYTEDVQNMFHEEFGYTNTSKITVDTPVVQEILEATADADNYQLVLRFYESTPDKLRDFVLDELMRFQLKNASVEDMLNTIQAEADTVFGN